MRLLTLGLLAVTACTTTRQLANVPDTRAPASAARDISFSWRSTERGPVYKSVLRNCSITTGNDYQDLPPNAVLELSTGERNGLRLTEIERKANEADGHPVGPNESQLVVCPRIERLIFSRNLVAFPVVTAIRPNTRTCEYQVGEHGMVCAGLPESPTN